MIHSTNHFNLLLTTLEATHWTIHFQSDSYNPRDDALQSYSYNTAVDAQADHLFTH